MLTFLAPFLLFFNKAEKYLDEKSDLPILAPYMLSRAPEGEGWKIWDWGMVNGREIVKGKI